MIENKSMAKSKSRAKKTKSSADRDAELIVIDESAGLIFESEDELSAYFQESIDRLENEYQSLRAEDDYSDEEQLSLENHLEECLDDPDEVWRDEKSFPDFPVHIFVRECEGFQYIAVAYLSETDEEPTFVLSHFPTRDAEMVANFQRGELVYDRRYERVQGAAIDGDALVEGDPLAIGLYLSMVKLRSEKDVPESDFPKYGDLREETIEAADEIWRKNDLDGHVLVCFIKEFPDHEVKDMHYIAVTQEDDQTGVHALLFSFPTTDMNLVDRYRQGENLQAEEIVQESSH
ncbi:MAG: peptidase [Bdellovibrionaceae bacterium]|nr:peptidase [Pseudobdellovibrionaceae bacterium]MBX3034256.1 peptidase [Pseudobdellovibrionaceae bacterium]